MSDAAVSEPRTRVEGRACVLRGDDIDTDRILPARFMRVVTFDGLGEHVFEDDRRQAKGDHPLDDERFADTTLLVVGRNFGCGSSREHAPQALMRRGFRGFLGQSFAEIFFGNCVALGLPCATLSASLLEEVMDSVELDPQQEMVLDVVQRTLTYRGGTVPVEIPDGAHSQLLEGTWNATAVLLQAGSLIEGTADRLPYVQDADASAARSRAPLCRVPDGLLGTARAAGSHPDQRRHAAGRPPGRLRLRGGAHSDR
jgi:3-isopropylmalate/(R)-2-methylmalate dehydratase small subunit